MPKTSGAVLDWVPQKAAQQMQSDAMTRFMPNLNAKSRVPAPVVVQHDPNARWSAHIFDPFARCSQVWVDWQDQLGRSAGDGPRAAHERLDGLARWERPGRAVSRPSSLRCDQLFRRGGD